MNRKNLLQTLKGLVMLALLTLGANRSWAQNAQFRIPEAFSPNADGVNDVFFIKGLKVFDKAQLIVFNRNGQVLFDSGNGYKNNWAGTNSSSYMPGIGSDLPEGLYYYVFKPNGLNKEDVTGNLYIKR
jgi:gliding motility-associated-like protein